MDFILSVEVEARLAASPSRQIPLRDTVTVPENGLRLADIKLLDIDYSKAASMLESALRAARDILR